jgi:hypothetical protein
MPWRRAPQIGMVPRLMRRSRSLWVASGVAVIVLVSGCGGSAQDAHEPKRSFDVQVTRANFPSSQSVSHATKLELEVRNTGASTIPNIAVTVNSFGYLSEYPNLATRLRPVWIVDQGPGAVSKFPIQTESVDNPGGDVTATPNTWAAGALAPGQARTFIWHVTPVKSGDYTIDYSVAAGLNGKAHAVIAGGATPGGHFTVHIASAPRAAHLASNGAIVAGPVPPTTP